MQEDCHNCVRLVTCAKVAVFSVKSSSDTLTLRSGMKKVLNSLVSYSREFY